MTGERWPSLLTRDEAKARLLEASEHYAGAVAMDPADLLQDTLEEVTGLTVAILGADLPDGAV